MATSTLAGVLPSIVSSIRAPLKYGSVESEEECRLERGMGVVVAAMAGSGGGATCGIATVVGAVVHSGGSASDVVEATPASLLDLVVVLSTNSVGT